MDSPNLIKTLSETVGVSGYEKVVRKQLENTLGECADVEIQTDRIGNLVCYKKGTLPTGKTMIIAHMDEVGFQVMSVDEDDNATVKVLGNIKTWNVLNQKVSSSDGSKKGIICCDNPEGIKAYDFDKIKIMPIKGRFEIGDVLGFDVQLVESENQWIGKAMDNRVSCFILCELLKSKIDSRNDIYFVFSVQEESGMRGARVAITSLTPDIIIDVDVSPVGERNSLKIGAGAGVKLSDSIGVSSGNLVEQVEEYAKNNGIMHQREVSDCGTSELIITNERDSGAERVGISIPCKNMHSPLTIVNKNDVRSCEQLLEIIIKNGLYSVV